MKRRWKRVGKWARDCFPAYLRGRPDIEGMENRAEIGRYLLGGKVTPAGSKRRPFQPPPQGEVVLLKPSIRADFLLFLAAPRPGTDSTINSRKGNWKECPRKRACGRQAGRQQDWTPPGHSPGLSFLQPQLTTPSCHLQRNEKGQRTETKLDLRQPSLAEWDLRAHATDGDIDPAASL